MLCSQEREDFAILVQKYQTELAQKDKEIAFLKQNTQEKDLKEKVFLMLKGSDLLQFCSIVESVPELSLFEMCISE